MKNNALLSSKSPVWNLSANLVFVFCLIAAVIAWRVTTLLNEKARQDYFQSLIAGSENALSNRFNIYEHSLLAVQGYFRGSSNVRQKEWSIFGESMKVEKTLPGVVSIGYAENVRKEDIPSFEQRARADSAPDFTVHPPVEREQAYIIKFLEPLDKARSVLGLDLGFEENRRTALEKAWETGLPTLTPKINLFQGREPRPGFHLMVPIYDVFSDSERTRPARAWAFAPFIGEEFLQDIAISNHNELNLEVFDGRSTDEKDLIYRAPSVTQMPSELLIYRQENVISIGGREWTLVWRPTLLFNRQADNNIENVVLICGLLFSILIGAFVHFISSSADHVRQQVWMRTRELEEANRAKSDFLARMSHEIRTPLNGILGFIDMVKQTELNSFQRGNIEKAERAGQTLMLIISDILDLSKAEAGKMTLESQPFRLANVLTISADMVRKAADDKGLPLTMQISATCPDVLVGDRYRIMQIILNLLGNAVKFTDTGSVRIGASYQDGRLDITVQDTGIGIAKENQSLLFENFMQEDASTTRRFGGTGLGLAITKRLVDAMNGDISFESEKGVGTTFRVSLPLPRGTIVTQEEGGDIPVEDTRPYSILLVEDTVMNQEITRAMLERYGHKVTVADNGANAVEAVRNGKFDIVLMDIQMPVMDGIEASREIRETLGLGSADLPIIALTAHTGPEDVAAFFEVGIDDYLLKPVKAPALMKRIQDVLNEENTFFNIESEADNDNPVVLFDKNQYKSLTDVLGEEKTLEIYGEFKRDAGERFAALLSGFSREDVRRELHSMASMAGNMGFVRMEAECRRLMENIEAIGDTLLGDELRALHALYEQGCTALEQVYGRPDFKQASGA